MRRRLIDAERNEWQFELTREEAVKRICECLKPTNPTITESDIYRDPNSKEYKASFVSEYGDEVKVSVDIGNLKRYFGSRLIELDDDTGGIRVRRRVPLPR